MPSESHANIAKRYISTSITLLAIIRHLRNKASYFGPLGGRINEVSLYNHILSTVTIYI